MTQETLPNQEVKSISVEINGQTLIFETGKIARQANGAVYLKSGDNVCFATACAADKANENIDFFPLTVNYQEKTFAAGKIPGGFFKREARPTEKETLTSRLIDRPVRPLFHPNYKCETQLICTVLAHDLENDPDIVAMIGTSAALTISGIPFMGPIGASRVGYIDGEYILNPVLETMQDSQLNLVVAGTNEGVLMVESEANELSEEIMLGAVMFGHKANQEIINSIVDLAQACAKDPRDVPETPKIVSQIKSAVQELSEDGLREAYSISEKSARQDKISSIKATVMENFIENEDATDMIVGSVFKEIEKDIVRKGLIKTGQRIDGRDTKTVRPIVSEVGILPRAHGSSLFTRGETQAMVVATLGTGQDEQIIDGLDGDYREHFMLHYNFPPYSVGEAGRMAGPGRREIGHGKLAWRAIRPVMPEKESFPYTIRIVSEITESNGSSSMATVCGTSLSMMDAGVPLIRPVAGIAMGLIKEEEGVVILSDILGDEDHLGDMDFKVAGTETGITALQMDIKITSITEEIMRDAVDQAREGRLHILEEMSKALTSARDGVSDNAPRITVIKVPVDKIREIIGPGGKMIREICETTGAKIDIDDDGTVKVAAVDEKASDAAVAMINDIAAEPEVGVIYSGTVVKTVDFGAFVNFMGARDGLVHISELRPERVEKTTDIINVGDKVKVKLVGIDDRGKVKLSMKSVDQETGEDISS